MTNKIDAALSRIDQALTSWEYTKRMRNLMPVKTANQYQEEMRLRRLNKNKEN